MSRPAYLLAHKLHRVPGVKLPKRVVPNKIEKPTFISIRSALENALIQQYGPIPDIAQEQLPICLFNVFTQLMPSFQWSYEPSKTESVDILSSSSTTPLKINCFDLAKAFIEMAIYLGIDRKEANEKIYAFMLSKPLLHKHNGVTGKFACFDETAGKKMAEEQNVFFFEKHCVAELQGRFYDLTFLCHYDKEFDIFDTSPKAQIFSAAAKDDLKKLSELLKIYADFDINAQDNTGLTLMHWAAINNNLEMAHLLHEYKADFKLRSNAGKLPLEQLAFPDSELFLFLAKYNDAETVKKYLLEQELILNKTSAALSAIEKGDLEKLILVIKIRSLDINHQDEAGWTLLQWATHYKQITIVQYLLENKADANISTNDGLTPIESVSVKSADCELFKALEMHSDPKNVTKKLQLITDNEPFYNLMSDAVLAIERGDLLSLTHCLKQGLDINFQDKGGWTLLHWAAHYEKIIIAKHLVRLGADRSIMDDYFACPSVAFDLAKDKHAWEFLKPVSQADAKPAAPIKDLGLMPMYKSTRTQPGKTHIGNNGIARGIKFKGYRH